MAVVAGVIAVAGGVVLRFVTSSALWLDEAQSVSFAKLPLSQIPDALRQDGAPPLYYMLLHAWMAVFGDSDIAVRALSGICSVAAIAVAAVAIDALVGRRAAAFTAVILATNPFAIRYATEARMYGLITLEVAIAVLGVVIAFRPERARTGLVVVAVSTAAILYTHYWGLYMAGAAVAILAAWTLSRSTRRERVVIRNIMIAIGAGVVLWLPWLPTFLYQNRHTGTPWASAAAPAMLVQALFDLNGGLSGGGLTLTLVVLAAAAVALVAHRATTGRLELGAPRPDAPLAFGLLVVLTLAAGLGVGLLFGVAYANRYISIVLVPFVIVAALGVNRLGRRGGRVLASIAAIVGLLTATSVVGAQRSQAPRFAAALASAPAGDVVVYCPDQLGPATSRLLPDDLTQLAYPRGVAPTRVDWVDYADAWQAASPGVFAARVDALAADHDLWVVINTNYYGTEADCRTVLAALQRQRPNGHVVVGANGRYFENGSLWELPPG